MAVPAASRQVGGAARPGSVRVGGSGTQDVQRDRGRVAHRRNVAERRRGSPAVRVETVPSAAVASRRARRGAGFGRRRAARSRGGLSGIRRRRLGRLGRLGRVRLRRLGRLRRIRRVGGLGRLRLPGRSGGRTVPTVPTAPFPPFPPFPLDPPSLPPPAPIASTASLLRSMACWRERPTAGCAAIGRAATRRVRTAMFCATPACSAAVATSSPAAMAWAVASLTMVS